MTLMVYVIEIKEFSIVDRRSTSPGTSSQAQQITTVHMLSPQKLSEIGDERNAGVSGPLV
jgi:hypothetical protein